MCNFLLPYHHNGVQKYYFTRVILSPKPFITSNSNTSVSIFKISIVDIFLDNKKLSILITSIISLTNNFFLVFAKIVLC